jgi:hypothetical protein
VAIEQRPIKSSRSVSSDRAKTTTVESAAARTASASVKSARLSVKEKMKASGAAKEQGEEDMKQFVKEAEAVGDMQQH